MRWGAIALLVVVAACSDDTSSSPTTTAAPTPSFVGDGSPFCNAMLGVGQVAGAEGATPEQVLEANRQLVAHLDEAQANTPADAPPDFDLLIDDYRKASNSIIGAGGDVQAAFTYLQETDPGLVARLRSSSSHQAAYDFLVERCGVDAP